jgi:hypothetical protein
VRIERSPLGLTVVDADGRTAGRVEDTFPYDGCHYEFAVVRLTRGRFGERRMVPLQGAVRDHDLLQVPFSFAEIDDAPAAERSRYGVEPEALARAYWMTVA